LNRRVPTVIVVETVIQAEPAIVFDLELDMDAHASSVPGSRETATTSTGRRSLGMGDEVSFRAVHFGIRWTLTSRITLYDRPLCFVDEQVRGPFRTMRHEHRFEPLEQGGTRMADRMSVTAPAGPVGALVARALLAPYLRRLLRRRGRYIKNVAEARTS
jgi:ligand-binding SRPBCC domain-containing protein